MQSGRASQSAQGTAALRADHLLFDESPVFRDEHALAMLDAPLRESVESGAFRSILEAQDLRPTQGHILARARIVEEALEESVGAGLDQYCVLGAGLDTFLLRAPPYAANLSLFEVDHPATQRAKRDRIEALGLPVFDRMHFVSVDFESESLRERLAASPLRGSSPCLYSWLGVVTYLTGDAFRDSLESVHRSSARGSEVIFDFPIDPAALDPRTRATAEAKSIALAEGGEERLMTYSPETLTRTIESLGFDCVSLHSAADLDRRYFEGRTDGVTANPENWIARIRSI